MEHNTLFNIKSSASISSEKLMGSVLNLSSLNNNKTDGFQAAFKKQVDFNVSKKSAVNDKKETQLPQSGKQLPDKKITKQDQDIDNEKESISKDNNLTKNANHASDEHEVVKKQSSDNSTQPKENKPTHSNAQDKPVDEKKDTAEAKQETGETSEQQVSQSSSSEDHNDKAPNQNNVDDSDVNRFLSLDEQSVEQQIITASPNGDDKVDEDTSHQPHDYQTQNDLNLQEQVGQQLDSQDYQEVDSIPPQKFETVNQELTDDIDSNENTVKSDNASNDNAVQYGEDSLDPLVDVQVVGTNHSHVDDSDDSQVQQHEVAEPVDKDSQEAPVSVFTQPLTDSVAVQEQLSQARSETVSQQTVNPVSPELDKQVIDKATSEQKTSVETTEQVKKTKFTSPVFMASNEFSSRSGNEHKGDQGLAKHVSEFQQYIEMSKKQSNSGEMTVSAKSFQQTLQATQTSEVVRPEVRLSNAQLTTNTPNVAQPVTFDRVNTALSTPATNGSQTQAMLDVKTPVGKSGWNQSFSNQIMIMANQQIKQAKIRLNPAHLGPIEATIRITAEAAVVNLTSMHLTTKDAMENAVPRLKEMLNENGFSQVDVNVSHQDKKEQQEANSSSNSEHGNSTMPSDEQLSESEQDSELDKQATSDPGVLGLNIVDYYA